MGFPARGLLGRSWMFGLVVMLGCAGPPADQPPQPPPPAPAAAAESAPTDRACQLLPRIEAEAVLGDLVDKVNDESTPETVGLFTRGACFYRSKGGTAQLTVHTFADAGVAGAQFTELKGRYRGNDVRSVDDVGQGGFQYQDQLVILSGRRHLMVEIHWEGLGKITDYSNAQQMDRLLVAGEKIAVKAIARLPSGG